MKGLFLDYYYELDCTNKINYYELLYGNQEIKENFQVIDSDTDNNLDISTDGYGSGRVILTKVINPLDRTNSFFTTGFNGIHYCYEKMITSNIKKTIVE